MRKFFPHPPRSERTGSERRLRIGTRSGDADEVT